MRSLRHVAFGLLSMLIVICGIYFFPGQAYADYATGGKGNHINSIVWAEWGKKGDVIPAAGLTKTQYTKVGGSTIALECTIAQPGSGPGYGHTDNTALDVWTAGSWYKDGLDDLYNRGGSGTSNQMTSAIHTKGRRITVSLKVSCSAVISGPGFPAAGQRVPVGGLVIADAESSNPKPAEYIKVQTTGDAEWRIIDRIRDQGCSSTTSATLTSEGGSRTMIFSPVGSPCARTGPMAVGLASKVSEATITMYGQGQAAVAVGAVINLDYGDAPVSYGAAAAQYPTGWDTEALPLGQTDAFSAPLAKQTSPTVLLGSRIDPEPVNPINGDGTQDDKDPAESDDEDAISGTPTYHFVHGGGTVTQEIACTGGGYIRGWVDWNRNGIFEGSEASDTVQCALSRSTLTWSIPSDAVKGESYLRLRSAGRADILTSPTGLTVTGEVEDHRVQISTYDLEISKKSDALTGKKFAGDEVTYTVTAKNPTVTPFTNASPAYVFDDLSGVLDDATLVTDSIEATVGGSRRGDASFDPASGRVTWHGALNPGETITLTYRVRLQVGGDLNVHNVAWAQAGVATPATDVTCENRTAAGRDNLTNHPCAVEQYKLMSLLKTFQTSYDTSPDAAAWTLSALGNFGGESDDVERVVPGSVTANTSNTFVVPTGESFHFKETAAPGIMQGYELLNPTLTSSGGKQVELVNRDKPASATWVKADSETHNAVGGSAWSLTGPSAPGGMAITDCVAADRGQCTGPDKDPGAGVFRLEGLRWGEHTLTETTPPPGYELPASAVHDIRIGGANTGSEPLNIGMITNQQRPGSVSWRKVVADTTTPLAGSVWKLTHSSGTTVTDITDCVSPGSCGGTPDKDPEPGSFHVEGLVWGSWRLAETSAPLGYLLTTREETFQIEASRLDQGIETPFENTRATTPVLPLTGGTPSDIYYYSGGGLLVVAVALVFLGRNRRNKHP